MKVIFLVLLIFIWVCILEVFYCSLCKLTKFFILFLSSFRFFWWPYKMRLQVLTMKETRDFQRFLMLSWNFHIPVWNVFLRELCSFQSFKELVAACLVKDPKKRPTSEKLCKHHFFKHARSNEHLARTILDGLAPLGDRFRMLKVSCLSQTACPLCRLLS